MTNLRAFTELWDWKSPAWWVALAVIGAYLVIARRRGASLRQVGCFVASMAAFLIALASPLATLASRTLFSAHMAQHLLLLLIVPLCAILAWPASDRREVAESSRPHGAVPVGWAAGVGAMWFWHIPALCTASMSSPLVFDIQIVSLMAAGAAFWWPVFSPIAARRMPPHLAAMYLFTGCAGCTLLGIYLTFSPVAVCPLYSACTGPGELLSLVQNQWGLTQRIDQQVGGLLMWVPACIVYMGAILAKLSSWYHVPEEARTA